MPTIKGTKFTAERKQRISEALKGRKPWNAGTKGLIVSWCKGLHGIKTSDKGQIPWNKGKQDVYSQETIRKMRLAKMSKVSTEEIVRLYKEYKSCNKIAEILNTNQSVVRRRILPLGIMRDKGWANRGRKKNLEVRSHMSEAQKKLHNDPIYKENHCNGKNNPFYGHRHKPETIEAMKKKLSLLLSGENNPQWQGGKSFEPYPSYFKRIIRHWVYMRDNYTCKECGVYYPQNNGKLVAHHKDSDKKNCSLDNLVTLCRKCHGITAMKERWGKEVIKAL